MTTPATATSVSSSPKLTGPHYMLISALGFALMGGFVKWAGALHIPLLEIIFVRALVSIALSVIDIHRAGVSLLGTQRGLLLARGIVGFCSLCCVFYAVLHLNYAQATVLQYLHPVFTTVLALWFLKERPSRATFVTVTLSLAGLGLMMWLNQPSKPAAVLGILAGLGGALGSACAYTLVRKLAPTEHPAVIVLYFPLVCLPAAVLLGGADFILPTSEGWIALLGVGCFAQLGQLAMTKAMRTDSASRATSFSYLQIVFAALVGWLAFGEIPSSGTVAGSSLIIVGAFLGVALKQRTH